MAESFVNFASSYLQIAAAADTGLAHSLERTFTATKDQLKSGRTAEGDDGMLCVPYENCLVTYADPDNNDLGELGYLKEVSFNSSTKKYSFKKQRFSDFKNTPVEIETLTQAQFNSLENITELKQYKAAESLTLPDGFTSSNGSNTIPPGTQFSIGTDKVVNWYVPQKEVGIVSIADSVGTIDNPSAYSLLYAQSKVVSINGTSVTSIDGPALYRPTIDSYTLITGVSNEPTKPTTLLTYSVNTTTSNVDNVVGIDQVDIKSGKTKLINNSSANYLLSFDGNTYNIKGTLTSIEGNTKYLVYSSEKNNFYTVNKTLSYSSNGASTATLTGIDAIIGKITKYCSNDIVVTLTYSDGVFYAHITPNGYYVNR